MLIKNFVNQQIETNIWYFLKKWKQKQKQMANNITYNDKKNEMPIKIIKLIHKINIKICIEKTKTNT